MRIVFIILISLIVVALQLTILPRFSIFGAAPNLILALSVAWAIYKKNEKYSWLILIPAIFQELLTGRPLGLIILSLWLSFSLVRWLGKFLFKQSGLVSLVVLSLIGVLSYELFFIGLFGITSVLKLGGANFLLSEIFPTALATVFYNIILCLLVYWLLKKIVPFFAKYIQMTK